MLVQQILNGLTNGSLYALMAVGVTMIYKSLGMLNFAHGDIMMLGTFICLSLINMNMPILAALLVAVVCTAAGGIQFLYQPADRYGRYLLYLPERSYGHLRDQPPEISQHVLPDPV